MLTAPAFVSKRVVLSLSLTELAYLQSLAASHNTDLLTYLRGQLGLRQRNMGRKSSVETEEVLADAIAKCHSVGLDPDQWAGKIAPIESRHASGVTGSRRGPGRPPGPPKPPRPATQSEENSLHFNRVWNVGQRKIAEAEGREFDESILLPDTLEALREHKRNQRCNASAAAS